MWEEPRWFVTNCVRPVSLLEAGWLSWACKARWTWPLLSVKWVNQQPAVIFLSLWRPSVCAFFRLWTHYRTFSFICSLTFSKCTLLSPGQLRAWIPTKTPQGFKWNVTICNLVHSVVRDTGDVFFSPPGTIQVPSAVPQNVLWAEPPTLYPPLLRICHCSPEECSVF